MPEPWAFAILRVCYAENFLFIVLSALVVLRVWSALPTRAHHICCCQCCRRSTFVSGDGGSSSKLRNIRLLVVLGSGGHTAEMLTFLAGFNHPNLESIHFILAKTDNHSQAKAEKWVSSYIVSSSSGSATTTVTTTATTTATITTTTTPTVTATASSSVSNLKVFYHKITRSREVGQGWCSTMATTVLGLWDAIYLYFSIYPDLVLCNGPGTCLPIVYCSVVGRVFGVCSHARIIFVESFARVKSMSLTGLLVYPFVDRFIVQWHQLQEKWPLGTEFIGKIF